MQKEACPTLKLAFPSIYLRQQAVQGLCTVDLLSSITEFTVKATAGIYKLSSKHGVD